MRSTKKKKRDIGFIGGKVTHDIRPFVLWWSEDVPITKINYNSKNELWIRLRARPTIETENIMGLKTRPNVIVQNILGESVRQCGSIN